MRIVELGEGLWGDARGWGMDPTRDSGIGFDAGTGCHVVSIKPGAVRGNHRHPEAQEWMIVFGAPVTVATRRGGESVRTERFDFSDGRPVMLHLEPGEIHAVRGEGPGTSYLVAFNDLRDPATEWPGSILAPTGDFTE